MASQDTNWEDATVFISSTFNDMHAERDYLVKEVFPELTEWCEKRHIRLTDIDLRWGVTEEDASNSKTIETCLRHVDKSRPFFLCFLGQRRGWVPDFDKDISDETKERYDFDNIRKDYKEDRSATEMEIEHALLKPLEILLKDKGEEVNTDECRHSIFFFRNGDYADKSNELLSDEQRLIYTNEYLKQVDISKVMDELNGDDGNSELYNDILKQLKDEFAEGTIAHPEFISELIYDIQNTDCQYYNNLIDDLVQDPLKENNLVIIAELKFKNPGIYKDVTHEIKDNDEGLYNKLMTSLDNYKYKKVGIDEFCEKFDDDIIKDIVNDIKTKNEEIFEVHEAELVNIRKLIEDKQEDADKANEKLEDGKKIHVVINDYEGEWNNDLTLPELSHYRFQEGQGKLADFKCDGVALKKVIISEFKKQFEMEFKDHIQEIADKNPEIYKDEKSDIIEIRMDESISDKDRTLANELDQQENFCHNNSEGFVSRDEYTNKLKEYVEDEDSNKICLVIAEAGLGKTMLLANFATRFNGLYEGKRLYKRFCGGSDLSSKTYSLWKSIIDEANISSDEKCYPHNIVELRRNIDDILKEIVSKDKDVVIIIDAINQMEDGMEMLNWFGELPDNLKLIISAKEIDLSKKDDKKDGMDETERKKQEEIDKAYQDKLDTIKKKNTISYFSLKKLDYRKEESIATYVDNIKSYVESGDDGICVINSELNYDKSLIFHIFNDKYSDKNISNFRCVLNAKSECVTDKTVKSVREFGKNKTTSDIIEIKGNAKDIKTRLESHLNELDDDSIAIIDLMSNDNGLIEKLNGIDYGSKTIIGVKKSGSEIEFKNQSGNSFTINELDSEKNCIIKSYLRNYLKELDEKEIHDICNFKGSKNPLFLKILLAELRVFGSFDQLKDEIKSFGDSPESAFDHVLERLEKDEIDRGEETKVAKPLFSLLASSRVGGLAEDEIVTIIKDGYGLDEKEVKANVNLNLRQVRPFMARKEMRHDFFYEKFREAAETRYKSNYEDDIKLLTDYFNDKSDKNEARRYVELPYYLHESGRIDELEDTLSSYSFIKNKLENTEDVYGLISDYDFIDFTKVEDGPLELIQRGLELSSPVLMNHPEELPVQLWGRMNEIKEEDEEEDKHKYDRIRTLLDDLVEDTDAKWLKPTTSVLYSPKSSIIKRLLPDGNRSSSQIAFTNDNKIIFGSSDGVLSMYNVNDNSFEVLDKVDSKIVKIILKDDGSLYVARFNGEIKKWDLTTRNIDVYPDENVDVERYDEIRDIYVSDTYGKIYAVSHNGVFSIDLETKELKLEDIEPQNYNQILVPRRNEAILVCNEREVDGWDVYEMRKAYNRHHQQNDDDDDGTQLDASEMIRFMGLNKRFLTLISENGQMKFWNTLKNSGGGESIDEERVCSPNDKFAQALTLEDENKIVTISEMGVLKVYNIPQPRQPKFNVEKVEFDEDTTMSLDIQTGIKSPTALDYINDDDKRWIIVGNENNDISVVDLKKKVLENTNVRHAESVLSIKIDGNHMITASDNGEVFTWDIDSEECINKFANEFRSNSISFNKDESKLVLAGVKTDKNGKKINKIATCSVDEDMWKAIEMPEDENQKDELADLSIDNEETGMGEVVEITQNSSGIVFIEENKLTIHNDEYSLDGTATAVDALLTSEDAFVGFKDGNIVKYPSQDTFEAKVACPVTKIKILGESLIAGYEDGSVEIFDLDGNHSASLKGHEKAINNIYVDDGRIITVSKDNTLKIWENDECVYTYFLDIYATAVNIKDDKLILGDALGNVRFFTFEN